MKAIQKTLYIELYLLLTGDKMDMNIHHVKSIEFEKSYINKLNKNIRKILYIKIITKDDKFCICCFANDLNTDIKIDKIK